jgi:hypothetical protein
MKATGGRRAAPADRRGQAARERSATFYAGRAGAMPVQDAIVAIDATRRAAS